MRFPMLLTCRLSGYIFVLMLLLSCKSNKIEPVAKKYTSPCGCVITDQMMIRQCPVDAVGDSVAICKEGTNNVIGSNRPPMTWQEYIASEYFGGEGLLVDCKTGDTLLKDARSPIIFYQNKKLIVDKRLHFDIYDVKRKTWIDVEIPVWRNTIYAVKNELKTTPDSLIFKPAFHGKEAFEQVAKEYETEVNRTDHYLIERTIYRLLSCSLCGDKESQRKLLNIQTDFSDYYAKHPEALKYWTESITLYEAYKAYLDAGGKREYYDLSMFVYFQNSPKKKK